MLSALPGTKLTPIHKIGKVSKILVELDLSPPRPFAACCFVPSLRAAEPFHGLLEYRGVSRDLSFSVIQSLWLCPLIVRQSVAVASAVGATSPAASHRCAGSDASLEE